MNDLLFTATYEQKNVQHTMFKHNFMNDGVNNVHKIVSPSPLILTPINIAKFYIEKKVKRKILLDFFLNVSSLF